MFGNVATLEGSHVTGKYRKESMLHTCANHAAWVPHRGWALLWARYPCMIKGWRGARGCSPPPSLPTLMLFVQCVCEREIDRENE